MADRLWVCHRCERIGDQAGAERHMEQTGHRIDQLDQETSDAVREQWATDHVEMVAALAVHGTSLAFPRQRHATNEED